ncbi:hypothetical protein D3P07_21750 [Paenibacillus sp. 1011MAR3C5]|uniref:hypothetical protein n=1 Tax=Paenibacillus sp. 1011MAR3C5 TaxID=1675787 RepID=UPI000E6D446A|nr:hypothetical protein [Paenibacillus sp. 1011MAR3C5]RJE85194.1 hypothetical protein D3P07_21750 [Paenibacillus sp. 1011MAR3C5]
MTYIDLDQLTSQSGYNLTSDIMLRLIIEQHTMSTNEVIDRLGISKQRLVGLKNQRLLHEIKKGIYSRKEVEMMRMTQEKQNRFKHQKNAYELTPAYRILDPLHVIINKSRFFDCLTMVKHKDSDAVYDLEVSGALKAADDTYKVGGKVYMLQHEEFDHIKHAADLNMSNILKMYTEADFLTFLESTEAQILGLPQTTNYAKVLTSMKANQTP